MAEVLTHIRAGGWISPVGGAYHSSGVFSKLIYTSRFSGMEEEIQVVREKGVVKWFNAAKGYGFIQRSSGEDVFVHFSAVQMSGYRTLEEGAEVEFEVKTGPKGLQAENVNRP